MANANPKKVPREIDVLVIGGGIAGLWLLNALRNKGYNALLLEQSSLGSGQTIASQGMVHGGIKYALGGKLTGSSEAIAAMPDRWKQCLRGEGDVDLSKVTVLSDDFNMWSTGSLTSKITGFFASKALRGRVDVLKKNDQPKAFQSKQFSGNVYRLYDPVLDTYSLVKEMAANCPSAIYQIDWQNSRFKTDDKGSITGVEIQGADKSDPIVISTQRMVLAAGEGNERLLHELGASSQAMQRRPLHQVLLKSPKLTPLFAHCIGSNASPRLTISSHPCRDGQWVWYLGGDLSTEGIELDAETQIQHAKRELASLLPWIDLQDAQWASYTINRAEPKQSSLLKPEDAFAKTLPEHRNVIVTWPTKLTLAPNLSDQVLALLDADGIKPSDSYSDKSYSETPLNLPRPPVAEPLWEQLF